MTKRTIQIEDVSDGPRVVRWQPPRRVEDAPEAPPEPEWDGTRTVMTLNRTMLRGGYGPNREPLDPVLLGKGDEAEFLASYDPATGRWIGPEAAHVRTLLATGAIAGTEEAERADREAFLMEQERGAWGDPARPDEPPDTSLRQLSRDQMEALINRGAPRALQGLEARKEQERIEVGVSLHDLGAAKDLLAEIRRGAGNGNGHREPTAAELAALAAAAAEREAQEKGDKGVE